ncbi:MAG: hypothetical protein WAV10_01565, partial [Minisyncoccia bacterium]
MKKIFMIFAAVLLTAISSVNAQHVDSTKVKAVNVANNSFTSRVFFYGWSGTVSPLYVYSNYGSGNINNVTQNISATHPIPYGTDSFDIVCSINVIPSTLFFLQNYIAYPYDPNPTSPIISFTTPACAITPVISSSVINTCSQLLTVNSGFISRQWARDNTPITGATSSTYTATLDGVYTVIVSDGTCTGTSASVVVDVNELVITACANKEICNGASTTISATGPAGTNYIWSDNGATGSSVSVNPTSTTTYYVTGTLNGCSNSDDVQVKV